MIAKGRKEEKKADEKENASNNFHNFKHSFRFAQAQTSYEKLLCHFSFKVIIFLWDSNILQSTRGDVAN